jgi:hypothetical protein
MVCSDGIWTLKFTELVDCAMALAGCDTIDCPPFLTAYANWSVTINLGSFTKIFLKSLDILYILNIYNIS